MEYTVVGIDMARGSRVQLRVEAVCPASAEEAATFINPDLEVAAVYLGRPKNVSPRKSKFDREVALSVPYRE
jgi:hypothetical protein